MKSLMTVLLLTILLTSLPVTHAQQLTAADPESIRDLRLRDWQPRSMMKTLETDDEYFDAAESHHRQGFWIIYGIFLPQDVLEKVYYRNAAGLLSLPR